MSSTVRPYCFNERHFLNDLEIVSSDQKRLYCCKYLLSMHSPYFRALLTNGCSETNQNSIELSYTYDVLNVIFNILCYSYRSELVNECIQKINNVDMMYDYFSACEEYQLDVLKTHASEIFSIEENLQTILTTESNNTVSLIMTIQTFELENIKKAYHSLISKKIINVDSINFNSINTKQFSAFFDTRHLFVSAFIAWTRDRDPEDQELEPLLNYDYNLMPKDWGKLLICHIRKFTKAKIFKSVVLESLTYSVCP